MKRLDGTPVRELEPFVMQMIACQGIEEQLIGLRILIDGLRYNLKEDDYVLEDYAKGIDLIEQNIQRRLNTIQQNISPG